MRHLVIGAGNMGKRHGRILNELGDNITYIDMGDKLSDFLGWRKTKANSALRETTSAIKYKIAFDSALICTPPETHVKIIKEVKQFTNEAMPLFVEKPLYSKICDLTYTGLSMVACNWRFCDCLLSLPYEIRYPSADALDLIHFVDKYWGENFSLMAGPDRWTLAAGDRLLAVIRRGRLHAPKHTCNMFELQMKYWRLLISKGGVQINSIKKAKTRTDWLIAQLN